MCLAEDARASFYPMSGATSLEMLCCIRERTTALQTFLATEDRMEEFAEFLFMPKPVPRGVEVDDVMKKYEMSPLQLFVRLILKCPTTNPEDSILFEQSYKEAFRFFADQVSRDSFSTHGYADVLRKKNVYSPLEEAVSVFSEATESLHQFWESSDYPMIAYIARECVYSFGIPINDIRQPGVTPLFLLCEKRAGMKKCNEFLLEIFLEELKCYGMDIINLPHGKTGHSPLIVLFSQKKPPGTDFFGPKTGDIFLMFLEKLLYYGANPSQKRPYRPRQRDDHGGQAAIHYVCSFSSEGDVTISDDRFETLERIGDNAREILASCLVQILLQWETEHPEREQPLLEIKTYNDNYPLAYVGAAGYMQLYHWLRREHNACGEERPNSWGHTAKNKLINKCRRNPDFPSFCQKMVEDHFWNRDDEELQEFFID